MTRGEKLAYHLEMVDLGRRSGGSDDDGGRDRSAVCIATTDQKRRANHRAPNRSPLLLAEELEPEDRG